MQHRISRFVLALLIISLCLLFALPALAQAEPPAAEAVPAPGYTIALEAEKLTLYTGDTHALTPPVITFLPDAPQTSPAVTYASSNPAVADVDASGMITALTKGSATITAQTPDGVQDTLKLTVKKSTKLTSITAKTTAYYAVFNSATSEVMYWNGKKYVSGAPALKPVLAPKKTTQKALVYASSDPSLVAVDEKGTLTILGAPADGSPKKVDVTVTSANNPEISLTVTITVTQASAAYKTPYCIEGVWYEKAQAPKQFRVGEKTVTVTYHTTVQGHNIYLDGEPSRHTVQLYTQELQAANAKLLNNKYIDYIIITDQKITSFFPEFQDGEDSIVIGVASNSNDSSGIILDGAHYDMGTMIHELAHMWDFRVAGTISDSREMATLYYEERMKLSVPLSWLTDPAEFLAYSMEDYFLRSDYFRAAAPKTTAYYDRLFGVTTAENEAAEEMAA